MVLTAEFYRIYLCILFEPRHISGGLNRKLFEQITICRTIFEQITICRKIFEQITICRKIFEQHTS